MHPVGTPLPKVTVEYDGPNGTRRTKTFDCPWKGKSFYVSMDRKGKHPTVRNATMSKTKTSEPKADSTTATEKPVKKATTKAPAKEKPAKEKPAKPAKQEVIRDKFGNRKGSGAFTINAQLGDKPKTCKQIAEAVKLNEGRVRSHLRALEAANFIQRVETEDGIGFKVKATKAKAAKPATA